MVLAQVFSPPPRLYILIHTTIIHSEEVQED